MTDLFREAPARKRRRRFRRDPEFRIEGSYAGRLSLRQRDLDMITAIAKHRYLNTEQVCRLFVCDCPKVEKIGVRKGKPTPILVKNHRPNCACSCGLGSKAGEHQKSCLNLFKNKQHVASRLLELYQAGYLERPIAQLQLRVKEGVVTPGSVPMVYTITPEGLKLLGEDRRKEIGAGKLSWVAKINEGGRVFMEHTLAVADVSISIDVAVRGHEHVFRLSEEALKAGMQPERKDSVRPFALKVMYKQAELSVVCDLAFALGSEKLGARWNYLAEVDMGHMPIERAGLSNTSILRKLIAYAKAYEEARHQDAFGWRSFRVIVLTTSDERVRSCLKAVETHFGTSKYRPMFLFGTLSATRDLLSYDFSDGRGNPTRLLPSS